MLFDTLRKKNQAEQEEREWNANRPADYVSRNKDAMDSLTGQIGSGFDWVSIVTPFLRFAIGSTAAYTSSPGVLIVSIQSAGA